MNFKAYLSPQNAPVQDEDELENHAISGVRLVSDGRYFPADVILDACREGGGFHFLVIDDVPNDTYACAIHDIQTEANTVRVCYIRIADIGQTVPTEAEKHLARFILEGGKISDIVNKTLLITSADSSFSGELALIKAAIFGNLISIFERKDVSLYLSLGANSDRIQRIVSTAYRSTVNKHRFLELYRLLEISFLRTLLEEINLDFLKDPKEVIKKVGIVLEAERKQLAISLEKAGCVPLLIEVNRVLERSRTSGNTFAKALFEKRSKSQEGRAISPDAAWFGAWYVYQIRCSIAHAGSAGIVFEDFPDSESLLDDLLEVVEEAAWRTIGFEF